MLNYSHLYTYNYVLKEESVNRSVPGDRPVLGGGPEWTSSMDDILCRVGESDGATHTEHVVIDSRTGCGFYLLLRDC